MLNKIALLLLLVSCIDTKQDTAGAMPVELVMCSHPDSIYEGVVQVEIEDNVMWTDVRFKIWQAEYAWETSLQTENQTLWWTRMQLYELDCNAEFDYEIIYY